MGVEKAGVVVVAVAWVAVAKAVEERGTAGGVEVVVARETVAQVVEERGTGVVAEVAEETVAVAIGELEKEVAHELNWEETAQQMEVLAKDLEAMEAAHWVAEGVEMDSAGQERRSEGTAAVLVVEEKEALGKEVEAVLDLAGEDLSKVEAVIEAEATMAVTTAVAEAAMARVGSDLGLEGS